MLDFPNYLPQRIEHGEPFCRVSKYSFLINQSFVAALVCAEQKLRAIGKNDWVQFIPDTGIWKEVSPVEIQNMLRERLGRLADETDTPRVRTMITQGLLCSMAGIARGMVHHTDFPEMDADLIPCKNTVLRWDTSIQDWTQMQFSPELNIQKTLTVDYDPSAKIDFFIEKMREILSEDDLRLCQDYLGAALFSHNYTHNFLYLYGEGGSGKGTLVLLMAGILGLTRTLNVDIKALSGDYELSALEDQTLLIASETAKNALCSLGAQKFKDIVGGEPIQPRRKYKNERSLHYGNYSLILTSNFEMKFDFEGSGQEWRRRLLAIHFANSIKNQDKTLTEKLLKEHGSEILNWLLEGAARVRRNNWNIILTENQTALRDKLIASSKPLTIFVKDYIEKSIGNRFLSEEAFSLYAYCVGAGILPDLSKEAFFKQLAAEMRLAFGAEPKNSGTGIQNRGYYGFKLHDPRVRA